MEPIRTLDFSADRYIQVKLKEWKNVGYFYFTPDNRENYLK